MQPTSPEGRAENPPPALQDLRAAQPSPKSGRGFGGGAPDETPRAAGASSGGAGAQPPPFLDSLKRNRDTSARSPSCGRYSLVGDFPVLGTRRSVRLYCKGWSCGYCGPRKARRYKAAIRKAAETHGLQRFVTLTLDPAKVEGDPVRHLRDTFNKLRVYLRRKYGIAPKYIAILEFQRNGMPHLHLLIDRYIPFAWIQESWTAIGGGRFVNIKHVDVHRVSHYLAKYLTKELLLSAPARSRRVTTARALHLLEKQTSEGDWRLVRVRLEVLSDLLSEKVLDISVDEDGEVRSFSEITVGEF